MTRGNPGPDSLLQASTLRLAAAYIGSSVSTMQTVWTEEVEHLAAENMRRCAEIADCKAQIAKWKQKLKKLQNEHRVHAQLAEVRRNPAHWNRLKKNEKFRKDLVEIVLSSASRGKKQEIPSLLRDWKQVPTFLRSDPDLFRLRLDCIPLVDYVPMDLIHNRPIMEYIFKSQPNLLEDIGSASKIWSDRDYYKLFLLHNDVTDEETNLIFQMFHFDVRNDSALILSLTQSDEEWQGLLKPSTGVSMARVREQTCIDTFFCSAFATECLVDNFGRTRKK